MGEKLTREYREPTNTRPKCREQIRPNLSAVQSAATPKPPRPTTDPRRLVKGIQPSRHAEPLPIYLSIPVNPSLNHSDFHLHPHVLTDTNVTDNAASPDSPAKRSLAHVPAAATLGLAAGGCRTSGSS